MFKLIALLWEEFFCSHIFTYRFAPHRFKNQQCGCVVTGQSISAAPANVTTTTVKQKCLSGRSPRNGMTGKHLHVMCFYNDSINNGSMNLWPDGKEHKQNYMFLCWYTPCISLITCVIEFGNSISPWYNRHGWLGIKNKTHFCFPLVIMHVIRGTYLGAWSDFRFFCCWLFCA